MLNIDSFGMSHCQVGLGSFLGHNSTPASDAPLDKAALEASLDKAALEASLVKAALEAPLLN